MNVIESNWIPFVNESSYSTGFWVGLIASVAVWINSVGKSTRIGNISVRIFSKVKEENEFLEEFFDIEGDILSSTVGISCLEGNFLLGCKSIEEPSDDVDGWLFVSMGVIDKDWKFIVQRTIFQSS